MNEGPTEQGQGKGIFLDHLVPSPLSPKASFPPSLPHLLPKGGFLSDLKRSRGPESRCFLWVHSCPGQGSGIGCARDKCRAHCQSSGQGQSLEAAQSGLCNSALSPVPEDHTTARPSHPAHEPVSCLSLPRLMFQFYSSFSPSHAGLGGTPSISGNIPRDKAGWAVEQKKG